MNYLYWYLGAGACTCTILIVHSARKGGWRHIHSTEIGAVVFVSLIWPAIIFVWVRQMISEKYGLSLNKERKFSVTRTDLIEQVCLSEIEQRETVYDPLGAVPNLPFGHLNAVWKQFLENVKPEDKIWSFAANRGKGTMKEQMIGYVIVRGRKIDRHIITARK